MKLPEPLFVIINPMMGALLRSPLHRLMSSSLMLITYTGRKSGRRYTTPVRYVRVGDAIRCFTSARNMWWRNLQDGAVVSLLVEGKEARYQAQAIVGDAPRVREARLHYLTLFPGDAAETVEKGLRLKPFKRNRLNNGSIPCVLAQYRIGERQG